MGRRWSRLSFLLTCTAALVVVYWLLQLRLASFALSIVASGGADGGISGGGGLGGGGSSCSPSCGSIMRRLVLYLTGGEDAPSPGMLRREECVNDTDILLNLLLAERRQLLQPTERATYLRLDEPAVPVGLSAACAAALFPTERSTSNGDHAMEDLRSTGCFNRSYSEAELQQIYPVLDRLVRNFSQRGLEIFLTDGSLIGSGRHFGVIPWDDDVDFMIREDQKYEVRELLEELSQVDEFRFVDTEQTNQHWRLEILCQRIVDFKRCRFSLDLFFGRVSGRYYLRPEWPFSFKVSDIYPLRWRPFGPYLLPGPNRPDQYLSAGYSDNYYSSCLFEIHTDRYRCDSKVAECNSLRAYYPFVSRLRLLLYGRMVDTDVLVWRRRLLAVYIPQQ